MGIYLLKNHYEPYSQNWYRLTPLAHGLSGVTQKKFLHFNFKLFSCGSKPGLELGAVLGLGITQESPQHQLVDLQGYLVLENSA